MEPPIALSRCPWRFTALESSYQEIELLAKSLNNTAFAHVYASPLKRARVTAMTLLDNLEQTVAVYD